MLVTTKKGAGNRIDVKVVCQNIRLAVVLNVRSKDVDIKVYANNKEVYTSFLLAFNFMVDQSLLDVFVLNFPKIKFHGHTREEAIANVISKIEKLDVKPIIVPSLSTCMKCNGVIDRNTGKCGCKSVIDEGRTSTIYNDEDALYALRGKDSDHAAAKFKQSVDSVKPYCKAQWIAEQKKKAGVSQERPRFKSPKVQELRERWLRGERW